MAKKTIKECENIEFLPQKIKKELKEQSDKNILSTLCCDRFSFSDYAKANGGFFFTSLKELAKESLVDESTVKRRLALLQMKKYIERKSGTNHQCTHYKLSKEIEQLLGIEDDEYLANEPLDKIREDKTRKEEISTEKLSTEQTSTDKLSTVESSTDKQTTVHTTESTHDIEEFHEDVFLNYWKEEFKKCDNKEALKKDFIETAKPFVEKGLLDITQEKIDYVFQITVA